MVGARVNGHGFFAGGEPVTLASPDDSAELTARRLAFERLTDQRLLRAYRLASLVLHDRGAAEDAVHDAAVIAWTRFADLRDPSSFDPWFDRIVAVFGRSTRPRYSGSDGPTTRRPERSGRPSATRSPGSRPSTASWSSCATSRATRSGRSPNGPASEKAR